MKLKSIKVKRNRNGFWKAVSGLAAIVGLTYVIAKSFRDVVRYMKIRSM